jgi:DUF4097 and DUF4098 domain-containing protein YvlB
MRTHAAGRVIALVMLAAAPAARADKNVDRTLPCAADGTVSISNVAGRVDVVAWDRAEVHVVGTLDDDVEKLRFEADGGDVEIKVVLPERSGRNGGEANLEVHVPRGARVEAETVSAPVTVKGTKGELELETVSGAIDLDCEAGSADLSTVSGTVDVEGQMQRVEAESVSGTITLRETSGDVDASTTSGSIEIRGGNFKRVSCSSVSGPIRFEGTPSGDADLEFENFSGRITLLLPADLDSEVEAETFSGSIHDEFGGAVHREKHGPGASLNRTYGKGSASLSVSTFSGSIELKKK